MTQVPAIVGTRLAEQKAIYVALDADELSPRRQALSDLLLTVDGCGVLESTNEDDPTTILAQHVDQWDAWIREGRLGQALQDVDTLPQSLDQHKIYLRIQMLYRAGHLARALQAIRERLKLDAELDPISRAKVARVAQDANASGLAAELLSPIIDELDGCEDLESALATARAARLTDTEAKLAARLEALFPGNASLQHWQLEQLVRSRNYASAANFAREKLGDDRGAVFYDALARHLLCQHVPDYLELIAEGGCDRALVEAYRMASVGDALARNLLVHAFELVTPLPSTPEQSKPGERLLLDTLEALLLASSKGGEPCIPHERFLVAVLSLIERLAADPDNRALRVRLVELMQPAIAGTAGFALMAVLVLQLASRPIELRKGGAPRRAGMDWLRDRESFLTAAFAWMNAEAPVVIGRCTLPVDLLTEPADEVVSAVSDLSTAEQNRASVAE